jgi:hypothetical protein
MEKDFDKMTDKEKIDYLMDLAGSVTKDKIDLEERLAAAEKALQVLSNTLHVIDATSLLSLYSLIKTDNLRQPNFESNQDIIDSGCSDAINRMMKTVVKVNAAERKKDVPADTSE